ncbi:hypothetical protein HDU78_005664 [Chytriomyces hyalinus]|nr:hypothetical protein HDU78_005664 [Chytriomyces hyalinus]
MQRQYLYHRLSKDTFRPTKLTIGPWSADSQHGGPPSALMASLLRAHAGDAFRLARLSVSLYRPVPTVGVHRLTITSLNETRSTKHLSITYADAESNKLFARAEAILLIKQDATATPATHAHLVQIEAASRVADVSNKVVPVFPDGATLRKGVTVLAPEGKLSKFMHVMQAVFSVGRAWFGAADERLLDANRESPCVWYVRSSAGVGLWVDETVQGGGSVGESRDLDLLESAIMFGDASSGASGVLKWGEFMYSNIDYTVNFLRDPEPLTLNASTKDTDQEWVCFRSRTRINPAGSGVTVSDVYDRSGPFATTTQNLVVRKMESKLFNEMEPPMRGNDMAQLDMTPAEVQETDVSIETVGPIRAENSLRPVTVEQSASTDLSMDLALRMETLDVRDRADQTLASHPIPQPATSRDNPPEGVPNNIIRWINGHGVYQAMSREQYRFETEKEYADSLTAHEDYMKHQWERLNEIAALSYISGQYYDYCCSCLDKKKGCIANCSYPKLEWWESRFQDDRQELVEEILQARCNVNIIVPSNSYAERVALYKRIKQEVEDMDETCHIVLNSCPSPFNARTQLVNQLLKRCWMEAEFEFNVPGLQVLKVLNDFCKVARYPVPELRTDFVYEKLVTKNGPFLSVGCGDGTFESALIENRLMGWTNVLLTYLDDSSSYPDADNGYRPLFGKHVHLDDATQLHDNKELKCWVHGKSAHILFNCPYPVGEPSVLSQLICDFLTSASQIQHEGSYVFIGITEHEDYLGQYGIMEVLKKCASEYTLRYIDNGIINTKRGDDRDFNLSIAFGHFNQETEYADSLIAREDYMKDQWDRLYEIAALSYNNQEYNKGCFCLDKKKGCIPGRSDSDLKLEWQKKQFRSNRRDLVEEILEARRDVIMPTTIFSHNHKTKEVEHLDETCHVVLNSCPSPFNAQTQLVNQLLKRPGWCWEEKEFTLDVPGLKVLKCLRKEFSRYPVPKLCTEFVYERLVTKNGPFLSVGCGDGTFESALIENRLMGWTNVILTDLDKTCSMRYPDVNIGYRPSLGKRVDFHVDATKLHNNMVHKCWVQKNHADILFNCPWESDGGVSKLICDFLTSASQIQREGSYVFIGISEHKFFLGQYDIPNVLKKFACQYRLRHLDNGIIKTVRNARDPYQHFRYYGKVEYFPETYVYPYHVMLCFERVPKS